MSLSKKALVKFISDKYAAQPYAPITIPAGASFADMVAVKGATDIGDQINQLVLGPLAEANKLSDMPDFKNPANLVDGKSENHHSLVLFVGDQMHSNSNHWLHKF
jgi:hypothetical protein